MRNYRGISDSMRRAEVRVPVIGNLTYEARNQATGELLQAKDLAGIMRHVAASFDREDTRPFWTIRARMT